MRRVPGLLVRFGRSFSPVGLAVAVAFFCGSLTPSLVPRSWPYQALISGLSLATGYAFGALLGWFGRRIGIRPRWSEQIRRRGWLAFAVVSLGAIALYMVLGARWQSEIRAVFGMPDVPPAFVLILFVAIAVALLMLAVARGLRFLIRLVARPLKRWIPSVVAYSASAVVVVVVAVLTFNGTIVETVMSWLNDTYETLDQGTERGVVRPTASERTGSPASPVPWESLGLQGRTFVAGGPSFEELAAFARAELGLEWLEAWDLAYASEKLRLARYAFSEQEVKQYLAQTRVLPGMFRLVETLYGLAIAPAQAPAWHPDVRFYAIRDRAGDLLGEFYVDLYARPSKRGGAWMDEAITRRRLDGRVQTPVAYLNCNFAAPVGGKPALLTHDEVTTLFHEFGHGLHHLLTRVDWLAASGINGVEWDAVELPSQFMENFCWEWDVLAPMTGHVDTGAPLPKALFERMLAARNFQSGMQMVRQLEFALFDLHLHYDYDPGGAKSVLELLDEVRSRVAVVFPPEYNRFPNNFSHVFAGGYAAGYYSYKWAEVLSADAYSLFEENGVLDPATGSRFRDEILAVGGSRPALESFIAFRGREPRMEALLRRSGMSGGAGAPL